MPFKAGSVLQKGAGTHKKAKNHPFFSFQAVFASFGAPPSMLHTRHDHNQSRSWFCTVFVCTAPPNTTTDPPGGRGLGFCIAAYEFWEFHEVAARQACPQPPGRSGATSGSTEHAKTTQYHDPCCSQWARSSKKARGRIKRPRTTHSSCVCVVWSPPQHLTHPTRPQPVLYSCCLYCTSKHNH